MSFLLLCSKLPHTIYSLTALQVASLGVLERFPLRTSQCARCQSSWIFIWKLGGRIHFQAHPGFWHIHFLAAVRLKSNFSVGCQLKMPTFPDNGYPSLNTAIACCYLNLGITVTFPSATSQEKLCVFFFFLILFLAALQDLWDISSLTRDQTHAPCIGSLES